MSLLNLGPNFVPATKRIPFMDIISATETWALDFQNSSKETDVEFLPQKVSRILKRNINIKLRSNLSKTKKSVNTNQEWQRHNIYPFDKGSGFVVLSKKMLCQK